MRPEMLQSNELNHLHGVERSNPSLAVIISTDKGVFRQLEPVVIHLQATNVDPAGRDLTLPAGHHRYRYRRLKAYRYVHSHQLGRNDDLVPQTNYHLCESQLSPGGGADSGRLGPSAKERDRLVANLVNDMTNPGEYTIVVEMDYGYYDEAGKWQPAVAHSNAIKVKVEGSPMIQGQ
jgi:hypothetical protein